MLNNGNKKPDTLGVEIMQSQCQQILKHLRRRSITTIEAYEKYKITRLAARIYDLKKSGNVIFTRTKKTKNSHVAQYFLTKDGGM